MFRAAVDVVTGFLGSGKTTLVGELVRAAAPARVAVVVNELAEVGLDGTILAGAPGIAAASILEADCICCRLEDSRFERGLHELMDRVAPDLVLFEASGAARPDPLLARLRGAGLGVDAIVCVVDGRRPGAALRASVVAREQLAVADFVVLSRADEASSAELEEARREVARVNARALTPHGRRGRIDDGRAALLVAPAPGAAAANSPSRTSRPGPTVPDGAPEIVARVFRRRGPIAHEGICQAIADLPPAAWRVKGIVDVGSPGWSLVVHSTLGRVEWEWLRLNTSESRLVVIGPAPATWWPEVEARLASAP